MTYEIISERRIKYPEKIADPKNAYLLFKRYTKATKEQFLVLTLNAAHEPISISIVSIGTANRTVVHPREVFYKAIKDMASAIIVCHNHPSGKLEPSEEDMNITNRLNEAGKILGIRVLDHLIISKAGFLSFQKTGHFPEDEKTQEKITSEDFD
jgi:DNA repair protein RadC